MNSGNSSQMTTSSLRSKRFRGVGEQRKSEERDFRRFAHAKNGARAKKRKEGEGKTPRKKHRKSRSSVFLCSQTPRKRLLRRLDGIVLVLLGVVRRKRK